MVATNACVTAGGGPLLAADLPFNDTMAYVHKILQETIEVEHSTIPLYLTSLFSIVNSSNFAGATLHSVVIEEMLHMTTACNMLNAMGGAPAIDSPVFIPVYPLRLPMINVTADIRRFDAASVANFMLIESTTALSKSIAACYEYVLSIVQKLSEEYGEPAVFTGNYSYQVQASAMGPTGLQTAGKIGNLSEARVALLGVSDQGGGCPVPGEEQLWPGVSNISAGPLGGNLSHYARFAQVAAGRAYGPADHVAGPGFPPTGRNVSTDWAHVYARILFGTSGRGALVRGLVGLADCLTPQQRAVVELRRGAVLVQGPAGSGKSTAACERVARLARAGESGHGSEDCHVSRHLSVLPPSLRRS